MLHWHCFKTKYQRQENNFKNKTIFLKTVYFFMSFKFLPNDSETSKTLTLGFKLSFMQFLFYSIALSFLKSMTLIARIIRITYENIY